MQRILLLLLAAGAAYYVFNPSSSATTPSAASGRVYIEPGAYRNVQVELYATDWCPYCKQARAFMDKRILSTTSSRMRQHCNGKRLYWVKNTTRAKPMFPFLLPTAIPKKVTAKHVLLNFCKSLPLRQNKRAASYGRKGKY